MTERRKKKWADIIGITWMDGMPLTKAQIETFYQNDNLQAMLDHLTDMGYILQTHTSSGRIPSDKGYRMYVNNLMKEKDLEIKALRAEMINRVDRLENTLKGLVENIAKYTNYGALISGPTLATNKIKYVQLSNLEPKEIVAVVVCEGNIIKTNIVETKKITNTSNNTQKII